MRIRQRILPLEKNQPVANVNQLLQVTGLSGTNALSEVSAQEPATTNLTKGQEKYTLTNEGESAKIEWKFNLQPNKLYFVEILELQAGSVIKLKSDAKWYRLSVENRFQGEPIMDD